MAEILKLITAKDRINFTEEFNYKTNFTLSNLIPARKTNNFKVEMARLVANGNIPVMAQFHALETEARIGDRTNYRKLEVEKLLIKEKINQGERVAELLGSNPEDKEVLDFVYDDMGNLTSRVLTRAELANNQVLATGRLEINENNFKTVVDFGYPVENNSSFSGWSNPSHDIIGDLNAIIDKANAKGKKITRALTSTKVVRYLVANEGIQKFFAQSNTLVTGPVVLKWIYDNFGIAIATNDEMYKTSANDSTLHRFYPENKITFFTGNGALGAGLYGITPEERELNVTNRGLVTIHQWKTDDPVATWTKASAVYLPVISDIEGLFIVTISK